MAGFFHKLFGHKEKPLTEQLRDGIAEVYDPNNEHDRVGLALLVTLQKQLGLLGYETGQVPAMGLYLSEKCLGYLYGLSIGILVAENIERTRDNLIDTIIAAFVLTYGDTAGRSLAKMTAELAVEGDKQILAASDWAIEEITTVYKTGHVTTAMGFYLAAKEML